MYKAAELKQIPWFAELLADQELHNIIDSLTGLISRPYMIEYVHHLIDSGTPFTFGILDLDNFKFINDTYGHRVGDVVLESVASDLQKELSGFGIAGRFGGDEFLFVDLKHLEYDEIKSFMESFYAEYRVLRKNINMGSFRPFITGTIGCASFPRNAQDYDSLFSMIDKTLYRGKTKGRNCYIIYVEEKHKDIQIESLAGHGMLDTFRNLSIQFDSTPDIYEKMAAMFTPLQEDMRISNLYYVGKSRQIKSVMDNVALADVPDIDMTVKNDLYFSNELEELHDLAPCLYAFIKEKEIETIMISRLGNPRVCLGYIICAEPHSRRIWQDDECAILFSVCRMLSGYIFGRQLVFD